MCRLRHCPRQGTELPALLLSASVAIYCLLGKALILESHNRAFSLLERHPRAQPQQKRLHCPERSKSSKPLSFIGQIKNKQSLSFLSFHSANAHSPPRLSRHPAGIKAGSRDGGAEMQHRGELRALTHRAGLCGHCSHPCPCQGSQGCAQDGGFKPLTFLLSDFSGFLFVLPWVSITPASPPPCPASTEQTVHPLSSLMLQQRPPRVPPLPDKSSSSCRSLQTVVKPF